MSEMAGKSEKSDRCSHNTTAKARVVGYRYREREREKKKGTSEGDRM